MKKKVSKIKSVILTLNKSCGKKSLKNKVLPFWDFIFKDFLWFNTKRTPEKSPLIVENSCEQKMFTTMHGKKRFDILNTPCFIQHVHKHRGKVLFYKNILDLTSFSQNLGLFFISLDPVILFPGTLFPGFFQKLFFSCDFLT